MVQGRRSAGRVLKRARKLARAYGWTVEQLPKRGKGSHAIYGVMDNGKEIGRFGLTGHSGDMSWTVTRNCEDALEPLFGQGWLD